MNISRQCVLNMVFLMAGLVLFAALPGQAGEKTLVSSVDTFDPYNIFGSGSIGTWDDLGMVACPGNEPTFPCPVGSRTRIREMVIISQHASDDPRLNGWSIFEYNANLDPEGEGPIWGKWMILLDDGGIWEGVYNGDPFGERVEFHGTGGSVDGLLLKLESTGGTVVSGGIAFIIPYEGYIVDPNEKK